MEKPICIGVIMHGVCLIFLFIVFVCFKKNDYVRFGPHKNLTLVNIKVDTHDIYIAAIISISLLRFTHIIITRLGYTYLDSVRQNNDKKTNNKSVLISTMINYTQSLSFCILIKVFITQLDFAILSVALSEALFIPFNYYSIHNYSKNENPKHILDITTINPVFSPPKLRFRNIYDDTETQEKKIETN